VVNYVPEQPYLSIIVPAFNEAGTIKRTLSSMRRYLDAQDYNYQVILASDGDDETPTIASEIAQSWPNLTLSLESGRHGKGKGVRRGVALATGEIIGFFDADYKTPIEEVTKVLPWLSGGFDLAIGSRALAGSRIEHRQRWYRRAGSRGFATLMHAIVGLPEIRDTQCGFKFFTRRAATDIFARARIDGYMCDIEILCLASHLGYRVKEVGIRWSDDGDSRLQLVSGNLRNLLDLLRIRLETESLKRSRAMIPRAAPSVQSQTDV
jgi:dolichyl-phosphate beta-glucosyltransferase